ncbi:MAG: acetoin utilization protein AcuC [Candidatus Hodarchaeales archaeon]
MKKTGFIWSDEFTRFNLGDGHPMNSKRVDVPYQLFRNLPFMNHQKIEIFSPDPAPESDLMRFHSPEYVKMMKSLSAAGAGFYGRFGLGTGDCPVFPELQKVSSLIVGGALEGAKRIMAKDVQQAFSLMGGLHHAFSERASGFCYYNDIVITIKYLQEEFGIDRLLYIDTDVHHGDGVLDAFYESKKVLGISFHESGQFIFPGTGLSDEIGKGEGIGHSINMPLFPGTCDDQYIEIFEKIIPCIWEEYDPEFVIWQCGADGHFQDLLGHLNLTTNLYEYLGRRIAELSDKGSTKGRLLLLGGGGYNPDSVARVWMTILAAITDVDLPEFSPQKWVDYCKKTYDLKVSPQLSDLKIDPKSIDRHTLIEEANNQYLQVLIEEITESSTWKNCISGP